MLDADRLATALLIARFFEFLDLDPAVNEIVKDDGLRYLRHPNGRFGCDILLDIFTFGLPANESVPRARVRPDEVPLHDCYAHTYTYD